MKKLLYVIAGMGILLLFALLGCTDELMEQKNDAVNASEKNPSTALEQALARAEEFFSQIGASTRSPRQAASVLSIVGETTRSELDTLLFLVNYADNQGFALLGADPAVMDIYAISPEGHLTAEEFNENPLLADFLDDAITYAVSAYEIPFDPITPLQSYKYRNIDSKEPMLNPIAAAWTQENPYNTETVDSAGIMCPVGCVNLSVGMLLSYYRRPNKENYSWQNKVTKKFNFNWDLMLASSKSDQSDQTVAEMFAFLGSSDLLNIEYNPTGSEGDWKRIQPSIALLGGGDKMVFNKDTLTNNIDSVASFLLHGRTTYVLNRKLNKYKAAPVIVLSRASNSNATTAHNRHAWIIDGVVTREKCLVDMRGVPMFTNPDGSPIYTPALPMWHCVWGFGNKKADGWYLYLKDKKELDLTQYDPFSPKTSMWPTGVSLTTKYANWAIIGGCFPENLIWIPSIDRADSPDQPNE